MNAPYLKAYIIYRSIMSDDPLPLAPDRGTSLTPIGQEPAGSATRRGAQGMAVALAAIFLFGISFGFLLGVLRG